MKNIIFLSVLLLTAYSCKKKDKESNPTRMALQGNWVQDSSCTYDNTLILTKEYVKQDFVVEGAYWRNLTSNWGQELDFHDDYLLIGDTRYEVFATDTSFSLTMMPQGAFTIHYTRWFSR